MSGFRLFSAGDAGEAHVFAHRMLDEGRMEEGYRVLREWLLEHEGSGSDWIHLQWHMAVFEISTGHVQEACDRFHRELLPAVPEGEALTDAPSLLWRLSLAAEGPLELDWQQVHEAARFRVSECDDPHDPYVELHHLLALAGARDVALLTRWLDAQLEASTSEARKILLCLGWALRTYATQDYEVAATLLSGSVERVSRLGGSRAQNELFADLAREASRRGRTAIAA